MEMLKIFTRSEINEQIGVQPSVYVRELCMPPADRQSFLNINNDCIKLFANRSSNELIEKWDVKPRIIFFSNWSLGEEYEVFFTVRNRYRTSKLVKLTLKDSSIFELEKLVNFNRLGSMVTFGYKVRFKPQELIDYHDFIKLEAENETLDIYILAVAPRPLIDFPDKIDFGEVLYNFNNVKQIRLENVNPIAAEATLSTEGVFTLDQHKLVLNPKEVTTLKVYLNHRQKKNVRDRLLVNYETGEKVYIDLCASCRNGNIFFEEGPIVDMGELFVGLTSMKTITLVNETDELLSYVWLNNRNLEVDMLELDILYFSLANFYKKNGSETTGMKYFNMITQETHEKIISKVLNEQFESHAQHYFTDQNFIIEPLGGQINPRSKQIFTIIFKPSNVKIIKKRAYLEINGVKDRLRLSLKGVGIGPDIVLNLNTIDFEQIFICSEHCFLIAVKNIGLVKGTVCYFRNIKLAFGGNIRCDPSSQEVLPGEVKHFEVYVSSTVAGSFLEDVLFMIQESKKKIRCTIKGFIINPRLTLDKKILDFGEVSLGFECTSSFTITNESPIPVECQVEVVGDGFMPATKIDIYFDYLLPSNPKEFSVSPQSDEILPGECKTIEVSLVSNIIRDFTTVLKIYLWKVLVEDCSVTLKYKSVTPFIICKPNEISLRYAFVDYNYNREITLQNVHSLPTFFAFELQQQKSIDIQDFSLPSTGLVYDLDEYSGYLPPHSEKKIAVELRVLYLKPVREIIRLKVFGIAKPIDFCTLLAYGMGPVVNPSTFLMSWGSIPVLKSIDKTLRLTNVSPISAFFLIHVVKYTDIWNVSLKEGSIDPESEVEIIVTVKLKDSGVIEDCLTTEIIGSRDVIVSLSAEGFGTSIVTVPNIFPEHDIGKVFRKEKHVDVIKITNAGTRHHTVVFTTMKAIKNLTKAKAAQEQSNYFKFIPYKLDLEGGETQEMHLLYEWDKIEVLEDTYYCYAIIERQGKRVRLGSCTIRASFTDTELTFEPTHLHFRVDAPTLSTAILPLSKTLTVFSRWSYTLSLECTLKKPFSFKDHRTKPESKGMHLSLKLEPEESETIDIEFNPMYISNRYSRICNEYLTVTFTGHKVKACVPLKGEVNFPNIEISVHEIDFGCILPNNEGLQYAKLANSTPLSIEFEWFWSQQQIIELKPPYAESGMINHSATSELSCQSKLSDNSYARSRILNYIEDEIYAIPPMGDTEEGSQANKSTVDITKKSSVDTVTLDRSFSQCSLNPELFYSIETKTSDNSHSSDSVKSIQNWDNYLGQKTICEIPEMNEGYKKKENDGNRSKRINELGVKEIMRELPPIINKSLISQVIDIIPAKGNLKPNSNLQVAFMYNPIGTMKVKGKALLKVLDGPDETVTFKGCCYPVIYEIIPPKINFGFGPFCELWCSSFFVWNKGLKDIHVCVSALDYFPFTEQMDSITPLPENFGLSPSATIISPFEVAYYKVVLFPGKIGEVKKEFIVQVDDLPPVKIDLIGYALPHQVHIALPRSVEPLVKEDMYFSIGSLDSQWFSFIEESKDIEYDINKKYLSMETEEWETLMPKNDAIPNLDDINMAYERYMCDLFTIPFAENIPHSSGLLGQDVISGFEVPPYCLDFGSIVTNTKAQCLVVFSNYCPMETVLKINFPENSDELLDRYGVVLKPQCTAILSPFERKHFPILLRPPHTALPPHAVEENITFKVEIWVSCGPVIPVAVKASITQPFLIVPDYFDFGFIRVGYKRIIKCFVKNENKIGCEWFAFIRPLRIHGFSQPDFNDELCPFTVKPVHGFTKPKSKFMLTIGFEPEKEELFEVILQFIINMNPQSGVTRLRGCGIKPHITVKNICFINSVPYSKPLKEKLTLKNHSLFPLQAFILGTHINNIREHDVFSYFLQYYRKDKICIPSTYYRATPGKELIMMFRRFVKKSIKKYLKDISEFLKLLMTKTHEVYKSSIPDSSSISSSQISKSVKLEKSKVYQRNFKSIKMFIPTKKTESTNEFTSFMEAIIEDNFAIKPLKEVMNDYIKYTTLLDIPPTNLTLSEKQLVCKEKPKLSSGNIFIIYGSPKSNSEVFTGKISHYCKMDIVSLDMEIIIDLFSNDCKENKYIRKSIQDYFMANIIEDDNELCDYSSFDTFEKIITLVADTFFMGLRKNLSQRRHTRLMNNARPVTLLNLPNACFQNIIKRRFNEKVKDGLIFDGLKSIFFFDPVSTLSILLGVFKEFNNIIVISLCTNAERYNIKKDEGSPNMYIIQAFSNLQSPEYLSLPESVRKEMAEEVHKLRKSPSPAEEDKVVEVIPTQEKVAPLMQSSRLKGKKLPSRSASALPRTKSRKGKKTPSSKPSIKSSPPEIKQLSGSKNNSGISFAELCTNEYFENLVKIRHLLENCQRIKKNASSWQSASKLKIEVSEEILKLKSKQISFYKMVSEEILKSKAKQNVDEEIGIPLWILCSHTNYIEDQFENYLPLVISWKDTCSDSTTESPSFELKTTSHNYFVIKKDFKNIIPKLTADLENECKLFKVVNVDEYQQSYEPVFLASTNVSRDWNQTEQNNEIAEEKDKKLTYETIKTLLKDMEKCYLKEMDERLKLLKDSFTSGVYIKPASSQQWDIIFYPTGCSTYMRDLHIGISGCETLDKVTVSAICDIPDISFYPCCVFSSILNAESDNVPGVGKQGYSIAHKSYHFGTVLIEKVKQKKLFEVKSSLKIKNYSAIDVKLSISTSEEQVEKEETESEEEETNQKTDAELIKSFLKDYDEKLISSSDPSIIRDSNEPVASNRKSNDSFMLLKVFDFESPELCIEAGGERTFIISAYPSTEGLYSCNYIFSVENNPRVHILKAYCSGTIPRVVFTPNELLFKEVLLYRQVSQPFNMLNVCKLPLSWKIANIVSLKQKVLLSRTSGILKPNEPEVVFVSFHPSEVQEIREQLVIQVFNEKGQGKCLLQYKYHLHFKSYDVQVEVYFESSGGKSIDFHNLIVFQKITEEFCIKNKGYNTVSVSISIAKEWEYLLEKMEIILNDDFAILNYQAVSQVEFSITCLEEIKLEQIPLLNIEVFDNSYEEIVANIPLYISLSSHFARFTVSPTHNLDFGNVIVGELKCLVMTIGNCGVIDFNYNILPEPQYSSEEKMFLQNMRLEKKNRKELKKKQQKNKYFMLKKRSIDKKFNGELLKNLSEKIFMNEYIKQLRCRYMKKSYNTKRKYLLKNLYLRKCKLQFNWTSKKSKDLKNMCNYSDLACKKTIKNIWKLHYLNSIKNGEKRNATRGSRIGQRTKSYIQGTNGKLKCHIPPFRIVPVIGKLRVGQTVNVTVHCNPINVGIFQERINLFVTDAPLDLRNGLPIYLSVESCFPIVNFEDYNSIFREVDVVDKLNEYVHPNYDGKPYEVFCIQEKSVYFFNAIIGTTQTVTAYLHAENQIETSVLVKLSYNEDEEYISPFSIDDSESIVVFIKPYGYSAFTIHFKPTRLEESKATITMSLEVSDYFEKQWWYSSISLIGKGNYPCIMLKEVTPEEGSNEMIDFGTIFIGFAKKKSFILENTGMVIAEAILEVAYNQDIFMIHMPEESLKYFQESCNVAHFGQATLSVPPGEKVIFNVEFKPKEFMTYSSRIIIHILYNPFELLFRSVFGSGYIGEVVIDGLSFIKGESLTFSGDTTTAQYFLDFGYCGVGKKYTKEFTLMNNCSNIIRYQFFSYHGVIFIPKIGHIFPGSKKAIVSMIQKYVAMNFDEIVECYYEEIAYKDVTSCYEWDNSLKSIRWTKTEGDSLTMENLGNAAMLKIEKVTDEPVFTIIQGECKYFQITVSATFDIPKLMVITEAIDFFGVIVSQSAEREVLIKNIGNCNASFTMTICDGKTETPSSIPEVTDFSFGKFDYDLNELPYHSESRISEDLLTSPNSHLSAKDLWKNLRRKHIEILYGKSVNIIPTEPLQMKKDLVSKHSSFISIKSSKKIHTIKSQKSRKFSLNAKYAKSLTSKSSKKPSKPPNVVAEKQNALKNSDTVDNVSLKRKPSRRNILSELQFSELVKIGHTYILLPSNFPKTDLRSPFRTDSQCFTTDISSGILKPNQEFSCHVIFTPKHIQQYEAQLRVFNVETEEKSFIKLLGLGILPLCHIEIYEDDYLTKNVTSISHIPSGSKVVTVESIFKETYVKRCFNVYNIAEIHYNFRWTNLNNSCSSAKNIKCITAEGEIPPRGKYEMEFCFFPMEYGVYESLWSLQIKEFFLEQLILLVFKIKIPMISFEPKSLIFQPTMEGFKRSSIVKLVNKEDFPFNFSVNDDSLYSGDKNNKCLCINPMFGTIGPNSDEKLLIEFTSQCTADLLFNIRMEIQSDIHHLKYEIPPLKVLSKCYSVMLTVSCQKEDCTKTELFHSDIKADNIIKIGKLPTRIPYTLNLCISNGGSVPVYFEAFLSDDDHHCAMSVEINEKSGVIHPSNSHLFSVTLLANQKVDFKELLIIKICKGPKYQIWLTGTAAEPIYEFNSTLFDFGICIIDKGGFGKNVRILEFSNMDTDFILLEKQEEKLEGFIVNFSSLKVEPRAVHKIIIIFHPLKNQQYFGKLNFLVNGIYKHEINLIGEGETFKLALCNADDIIVDFGLVKARELISKDISIINKSRVPVDFSLKSFQKRNEGKFQLVLDLINKEMHLLPDQVNIVKVYIYGKERIQNCTCNVKYEGYGNSETLFIVKGSFIDYEFSLDQKSILFEPTTIGCPNTKKIGLINSGDIGARFKIEVRFTSDVFSIKPTEGYSPPGSKTVIEISFLANFITKFCNNMLIILIENYEPLTLIITGIGTKIQPCGEIIRFKTNVRTKISESVDLNNRSYEEQILYPVISGEYFSTVDVIKVPANNSAECKIYYHPLTMTKLQFHVGHFFCAFPNGEALFYQLIGQSMGPDKTNLYWTCKAKRTFRGKIPIKNWSTLSESFSLTIDSIKMTLPAFYKITLQDTISVPPKKTRKCSIELICFKECLMEFKVQVTNINTKEYLCYFISVTFTEPEVKTIKLATPVRIPVRCKICLDNPMEKMTIFNFKSPHQDIKPSCKVLQVGPLNKKYLVLKYIPTVPRKLEEIFININNDLLGRKTVKLVVSAFKPIAENCTEVETPFGTSKTFLITVKNPYLKVVAFIFKSDSDDLFMKQPSFIVGPRKKAVIKVIFEPSFLGNHLMNITLHTNGFGDFLYPVKGFSSPPLPLGPLIIPKHGVLEFKFKNVFSTSEDFFFNINTNKFIINKDKLSFEAKETKILNIKLKDEPGSAIYKGIPPTGKLHVTPLKNSPDLKWDYYLKAK